jgi:hypothetical protein
MSAFIVELMSRIAMDVEMGILDHDSWYHRLLKKAMTFAPAGGVCCLDNWMLENGRSFDATWPSRSKSGTESIE